MLKPLPWSQTEGWGLVEEFDYKTDNEEEDFLYYKVIFPCISGFALNFLD